MATLEELAGMFQPLEPLSTLRGTPLEFWYNRLDGWKRDVMTTIDALPDPGEVSESEVLQNMAKVEKDIASQASGVPAGSLSVFRAELPAEEFTQYLIGYAMKIVNGGIQDAATARAVVAAGIMTEEEITTDFEDRWYSCQAIVKLRDSGALNPLFEARGAQAMSGMGAVPIAAIIVGVVIAIVAIAAVAYVIVQAVKVTQANKLLDKHLTKLCYDENGRPIPKLRESCAKLACQEIVCGKPKGFPWWMVIAAGTGVVAIVMAPTIVRSLMGAQREYARGKELRGS